MSSYRRRVSALEQAANIVTLEERIDRDLEAMKATIDQYAEELDVTPEALAHQVREGVRREAKIGRAAYAREFAAELGIPVEDVHDLDALHRHIDRMNREYAEWQEQRHAQKADTFTWRAGVRYNGHGEPA